MLNKQEIKINQLKKLPFRERNTKKVYNSLLVINSGRKHSSGYGIMYIIGLDNNFKPLEIAASCDDIDWQMNGGYFRNDMHYPSGAIHFWSHDYNFCVGISLSTTSIILQKTNSKKYIK